MTDYFSIVEDGLVQLLREELLDTYFPNGDRQVTKSDDSVLDNGNDYYAITYPGAFPITEDAAGFIEYSWELPMELMVRWLKGEKNTWDLFKAFRADVITLINHTRKGRNLGKTLYVRDVVLSAEEPPSYLPLRGSSPENPVYTHIRQVCTVTVKQLVPRE